MIGFGENIALQDGANEMLVDYKLTVVFYHVALASVLARLTASFCSSYQLFIQKWYIQCTNYASST